MVCLSLTGSFCLALFFYIHTFTCFLLTRFIDEDADPDGRYSRLS